MCTDCPPPLEGESSSDSSYVGWGGRQWLQRLGVCELWDVGCQEDMNFLKVGMVGGQGPLLMTGGSVV